MVKNRKKYVIIIIAAALIILAFAPRLFTEIRTQHFLKQNNGVDFGGLLSDYGDNFAVFTVSDTGTGISREALAHLFDKGYMLRYNE